MKKYSVVLGVSVTFDRTVVVSANDAEAAGRKARAAFATTHENLKDWCAVGLDGHGVLVVDSQEADGAEPLTEKP